MPETNTMILTTTIASGSSLSGVIDMSAFALNKDNYRLFGIVMPSAWTAANLTFQASYDGGTTWVNVWDATGDEMSVMADANRWIALIPDALSPISFLKIRSGSSSSAVNQASDRTLNLILRSY